MTKAQTREERMKVIKPELLSQAMIAQKLYENEGYLFEAIKNEFTIPRFILGLNRENEILKEKVKGMDADDTTSANTISEIKNNSVKIWELEAGLKENTENIIVYQELIEYLKSLIQ